MSARFERTFLDWYSNSRRANLEYLDLSKKERPTLCEIAHNLDVIYDNLLLHSKVSIKDYYQQKEALDSLESRVQGLEKVVSREFVIIKSLISEEKNPLNKESSPQPTLTEERFVKLAEGISNQLKGLEELVNQV